MVSESFPLADGLARVGIVGVPPRQVIRALNEQGSRIFDLDEPLVRSGLENAAPLLPRVYCAILRTVVVNALQLPLDAIVIDVGQGKCDAARHTARILAEHLPVPVLTTENRDAERLGNPICESGLPLREKLRLITASVKNATGPTVEPACRASAGFWGVPPRDFALLDLFPDSTHVYGWSRCMENKTPADHELEAFFDPEIPTVFFAQSFCAKTALARHLAQCHPRGLYLDVDVHASSSARAKIEAFLALSGGRP